MNVRGSTPGVVSLCGLSTSTGSLAQFRAIFRCAPGSSASARRRAAVLGSLAALVLAALTLLAAGPALAAAPPSVEIGGPTSVTEHSAVLHGQVNPEEAKTTWQFEYSTSLAGPFTKAGSPEVLPFEDGELHAVEVTLSGLDPSTTYYIRLTATNAGGTTVTPNTAYQYDARVETVGPPTVETYALHSIRVFKGVPQGTFVLMGNILPRGFETHYHFEYVTQEKFEHDGFAEATSTPELEISDAETVRESAGFVTLELPALEPGKTYHYRITATNTSPGDPVVHGNEQTLHSPVPGRTESGEVEDQPTPCPNEAVRYGDSARLPDCRAYELITPANKEGTQDTWDDEPSSTAVTVGLDGEHVAIETFARYGSNDSSAGDTTYLFSRTPGGWQMTSTAPQPQPSGARVNPARFFTPDLSNFLIERGWFVTAVNNSPEVEYLAGPAGGPYTLAASVPRSDKTEWQSQSRDGSVAVLSSEDHELLGAPTGTTQGSDLYEWRAGQLHQMNVQSDGSPIGTCGALSAQGWESEGQGGKGELGQGGGEESTVNGISADGSRIFFEAVPGANCAEPLHTYMRLDGAQTLDLGPYEFRGANPEGTRVLLSKGCNSGERGATCEGVTELFSYDTETDTLKHLFNPREMEYYGHVLSEDGNVLYFREGTGFYEGERSGGWYRYDISTETKTLVAYAEYNSGGGYGGYDTSPNGNNFYFTSIKVDDVPVGPSIQSYRYDAVENVIQCMTCASPFDPEPKLHSQIFNENAGAQASPLGMPASANGNFAFFSSKSELVPSDVSGEIEGNGLIENGTSISSQIYEWRRNGVDGCAAIQGCLALITDGIDGTANEFLGTDPSGRDVIIATHSRLTAQDTDTYGDLYDVRIGGGYPPPAPRPVECEGDSCSTPFAAPEDLTPSSATFQGTGDLTTEVGPPLTKTVTRKTATKCKKGFTKKQNRCVRTKTKKRKAKKSNRGAK